jgi:hypothetical protein
MAMMMLGLLIFSSCKKGFVDMNTDPNGTPNALPQQLLAPALVNTRNIPICCAARNFNNELMQVTVDPGDGEGKVFGTTSGAPGQIIPGMAGTRSLTNFKDMYNSQPAAYLQQNLYGYLADLPVVVVLNADRYLWRCAVL